MWRRCVLIACLGALAALNPPVASADDRQVSGLTGFTTPSGNIGCFIEPTWVRCDIRDRDWAPPPRPSDCEFGYGQGITLDAGGRAQLVCAGDTALGSGPPLAYGDSITAGALRCAVVASGVACEDSRTGRGFSLAREAYRLF